MFYWNGHHGDSRIDAGPPTTSEDIGMTSIESFEDHCWKDVIPEADIKLYAGWRRETFVGPRPALLAIDLYDLVYRGGPHSPYELNERYPNTCGIFAHQAIAPTKRLFAAARAAGIPIFYCTQDTRPNNRPPGAVSTRRQRAITGTDLFTIYHEFTPQAADIVIYKQRASAFQGTPIVSHLALLGIQSLIVCGESTSGCVRASVVDAYSTGFHVTIAEECTYDRAELTHKVNLFDLHHKYADVMHIDEVVAHLDGMRMSRAAE
jgi:maleamate amidohydrolase